MEEERRHPIDFGVYKPLGDGEAYGLVRYKTVEEVRRELVDRLNSDSRGYDYPEDFLKLLDDWDRWDQFPYRFKLIACYPVTGKRGAEGEDHYIHVEVVLEDGSHHLLYLGKTIWGFDHACRVANACAWRLGA
jgi:hypothetical protein